MEKIKKEYWEEEEAIFFKQFAEFSIEDLAKRLYPEFKYESPCGMWLSDWEGIQVTDLFLFYRKIIVEIPPNPEKRFRGGLSVPQIIELYKNGFILPIFSSFPDSYTSDIFKPLFQMKGQYHIPCNRIWLFLMIGYSFEKNETNLVELLRRRIENEVLEKYGQPNQISNQLKKYFSPFRRIKESDYRKIYQRFLESIRDLKVFGEDWFVKGIFAKLDEVAEACIVITLYRNLIYPYICGPGGYVNYGQKIMSFCRDVVQLYGQNDYKPNDYKKIFQLFLASIRGDLKVFDKDWFGKGTSAKVDEVAEACSDEKAIILPQDFMIELKERILYNAPRKVDDPLKFAYNLREYDCVEEHFRILKKLNDDFNEGKFRDVLGRIKNIREQVMPELNVKIGEIQKGYKRIKYGVTIGGTILASLPALPALQALTQGEIASNFGWVGSVGLNMLRGIYDERLSRFLTGLKFRRNTVPYLIWKHEKRGN